MSRLFISATRKSSGKTTVSVGLCAAFSRRGMVTQPFKKGPDYIDPLWLSKASGRACINLDFNTMSRPELVTTLNRHRAGADISVIEGNKGLFDGIDILGSDSNAALCLLTQTPVLLVLDAQGMTRGVAPLIQGYQQFEPALTFAGLILNKTGGSRHETKLRRVIEHYTDLSVFGTFPNDSSISLPERHMGLKTDRETESPQEFINHLAATTESHIDVIRVVSAANADPVRCVTDCAVNGSRESAFGGSWRSETPLRIGIARDNAFCFYYEDDLQAMERAGATLVFFDTLRDQELAQMDGMFIGGGFPETHLGQLEGNFAMRNAIREFAQSGYPIYAECGGLMYLARNIRWNDENRQMVGAIPADVEMSSRPVGRGYVEMLPTNQHPWATHPQFNENSEERIKAHEFHYSRLKNIDESVGYGYEVKRGHGIDGARDGIVHGNIFASYAHMRHSESNPRVHRFLEVVGGHKKSRMPLLKNTSTK